MPSSLSPECLFTERGRTLVAAMHDIHSRHQDVVPTWNADIKRHLEAAETALKSVRGTHDPEEVDFSFQSTADSMSAARSLLRQVLRMKWEIPGNSAPAQAHQDWDVVYRQVRLWEDEAAEGMGRVLFT